MTVVAPARFRQAVVDDAREAYLNGDIDEDELEHRLEQGFEGTIPWRIMCKQDVFYAGLGPDEQAMFFGQSVGPADPFESEKCPDPYEIDIELGDLSQ